MLLQSHTHTPQHHIYTTFSMIYFPKYLIFNFKYSAKSGLIRAHTFDLTFIPLWYNIYYLLLPSFPRLLLLLDILQSTPFRRGSIYLLVVQLLCSSKLKVSSKTPHKTKIIYRIERPFFIFILFFATTWRAVIVELTFYSSNTQYNSNHPTDVWHTIFSVFKLNSF